MLHRREYIENSLTLADSGTRTMDLSYVDPLTSIELVFDAVNGGNYNKENPILHNITKIEIVDGGDVITSIRGEVLRGLVSHINGMVPGAAQTEIATGTPTESVSIPFGRYYLDTKYAFQARAFRNPQLKLTWDLAHLQAVGDGGYVSGSLVLTAIANIMEDVADPVGVLTAKEVYDFTSAASGDERVELPTDYPIRTLGVRAYENGVWIGSTVSNLKLSADGGKRVLFDEETWDLLNRQYEYYGLLESNRMVDAANGDYKATYMAYSVGGLLTGKRARGDIFASGNWGDSDVLLQCYDNAGVGTSGCQLHVQDRGTAYENCIMIPFGLKDDDTSWLQATQFGTLNLFITQNEADGEVQVFVQEARPY